MLWPAFPVAEESDEDPEREQKQSNANDNHISRYGAGEQLQGPLDVFDVVESGDGGCDENGQEEEEEVDFYRKAFYNHMLGVESVAFEDKVEESGE